MSRKTLNLGILAHVDAGKTTLTERLLFTSGVIRQPGSVDAGTTVTDSLPLERRRGITIKSAVAAFPIGDIDVSLIDTRRIIAADDAARILILTTFSLDEYVYEALRAGASGFVLKDDPPEQLTAAVRTVAAGDALLSPAITKRVIRQFTRIPRLAPPKELDELTARERDILRLIAEGLSNTEIGRQLYISETTVKTHVTHILQKLGLRDRVQAVVHAYQTGHFDKRTAAQ